MSDSENFDGDEGFKNLRAAYEKQKQEAADLAKKVKEFETKERTSTLTSIFTAKGLKPEAASHYTGEVSEEAVAKWATDLGLLAVDDGSNDQNAEAARRAAAASGGSPSLGSGEQIGAGQRVLGSPEEILNALNTLPYDELVKLGYMPADPNQI